MTTRDRRPGELGDWGILGFGVLVGITVVALLIAAYAIGNRKGTADARKDTAATASEPASPSADAVDQEALARFTSSCGGCHTLAAAATPSPRPPRLPPPAPTWTS